MTTATRQDRVIRWITIASAVLVALTLAAAATALPILLDTRSGVEAQRRAEAITSCRSEIRAHLDLATAEVDDLIFDGLTAALAAVLTGDLEPIERVLEASVDARIERDKAVEAVRDAADLSASDPERFLEHCRSG